MKSKKLGSKIAIAIVSLVALIVVCLSPNLIGKLLGSVNSINTNSSEAVNTGVVLNLNKTYDYKKDNPIKINIYNGSNGEITINSIISRIYGDENFTITNLDTPITVGQDEETEYTVSNQSIVDEWFIEVGVQYSLTTEEDGTSVTKLYNIASTTVSMNGTDNPSLNSENSGDDAKEFSITSNSGDNDTVYIKLSDANIYMDKSESLDDLNIYYSIRSGFNNNWFYDHPQTEDATTNKLMFGANNQSNVKTYFSYTAPTDKISGSRSFSYSNQFKLTGTPNGTYSNVDVILGFYFEQYKEGTTGYEYWSDQEVSNTCTTSIGTPLVCYGTKNQSYSYSELPHFTLTVYDKSALRTALQNGFEKLAKNDEEVDNDSWNSYMVSLKNAYILYMSRDFYEYYNSLDAVMNDSYDTKEVTQSEIDSMVSILNNTVIAQESKADYTAYNELVNKIESKQESWYTPESYAEFKVVYDERSNYQDITEAYQSKLDNYVKRLQNAFGELVMLDADYSNVDAAITSASLITNKTKDGKYDLYSEESWNALQDAINSVDRSLKIENQDIVDGYAIAISNAQAALEEADAIYDELNAIIAKYKDTEAYTNNWYTDETRLPVEEYLKTITFDKKITEQSVVDTWLEELTPLVNALKLKKALGYLDSDNYIPFEGALSVEGYIKYLKELDRSLYTDETLELVDEIIRLCEDGTDDIFNISIDNQDDMDDLLKTFDYTIKYLLEKKPGDYTELCKYYKIALELNLDYYEDVSDLQQELWDISWNYKIDEQEKIDSEVERLKNIINNLVMKSADYTKFNEAYEKAKSLNANYYVDFSEVQAAISNANKATNLKIDKQSVVDDATNLLNDSVSKLVLKDADYSKINTLKSTIEQLDENKYTNFDIVKKALDAIVYGKKANEQNLVNQMYNELKNAYDNLQKTKANYSELEKAVENAKKYEPNKSNYTNYSELEKLINSINYTLTWEDQVKVDELTKKINDAIANLNKKPADYSELSNVLARIPSDYSEFDNQVQEEIKQLLKEARALPNNLKYDEQSRINSLVTKAKTLLEKLPVLDTNNNSNEIILSYLKVNGNKVDISKTPFEYTVDYDVMEAKIQVGLSSSSSTSKVYGGKVLMPGNNNITIIVTTKEGKTYTYSLIITRSQSSDYLSDLSIKQSSINFNKTKQEYNVKVNRNVNKLDLSVIAEDENAKVTINGNNNIKNGSKVTIEVESTDGSIRVYTLNIQKSGSVDISIILILIMLLAIIAGIFKYIQEKRKLNEENNV